MTILQVRKERLFYQLALYPARQHQVLNLNFFVVDLNHAETDKAIGAKLVRAVENIFVDFRAIDNEMKLIPIVLAP